MGEVITREEDVRRFYEATEPETALEVLKDYRVEYVYLGQLEKIAYSPTGLPKFAWMVDEGWLEVAYENEKAIIYRVVNLS
jgi:uncharacterized membrane protein